MYNYFMLIGTIYNDLEIKEVRDGLRLVNIVLSVKREFQNSNGTYDIDFFNVTVWETLAQIAIDNLAKGTRIGLKGRLKPNLVTLETGAKIHTYQLIADRLIFFGKDDVYQEYDAEDQIKIENQTEEYSIDPDFNEEDAQVKPKKGKKKGED